MTYRNTTRMTPKPELETCSGNNVAETYLLATWRPVDRGRDSNPGFRTELENLVGDAQGKRYKWKNREAESTDAPTRVALLNSSEEAE